MSSLPGGSRQLRLGTELGKGTYGIVYQSFDVVDGKVKAVWATKIMNITKMVNEKNNKAVTMCRDDVRYARELSHVGKIYVSASVICLINSDSLGTHRQIPQFLRHCRSVSVSVSISEYGTL